MFNIKDISDMKKTIKKIIKTLPFSDQLVSLYEFPLVRKIRNRVFKDTGNRAGPAYRPSGQMVSRELVEDAYRLFYGREPENDAAISYHQQARGLDELRNNFLHSDEFFFKHCNYFISRVLGELMFAPKLNIDIDVDREMLEIMISHIRKVWAEYGKSEPYWSVLTANDYKRENISLNMERFNDSGKEEVEGLESIILRNDIDIDKLKICLEYGCGVGRVTRWLAMRFEHVFALDISASHLQIAKKYLYDNELSNVEFIQMESLKTIDTIKKVHILYSTLVLQHNPPPIIAYIIRKLLDLVDKRGIAVFQIPTYIKGYQFPAEEYMKHMKKHKEMELHVLPQKKIFQIAEEAGCSVIEVIRYPATDSVDHISNLFVMQKR